jgi:hypothetical protein
MRAKKIPVPPATKTCYLMLPAKKVFTTSSATKNSNEINESTNNNNKDSPKPTKKPSGIKKRQKKTTTAPSANEPATNANELEIIGKGKEDQMAVFGLKSPVLNPVALPFVPKAKPNTKLEVNTNAESKANAKASESSSKANTKTKDSNSNTKASESKASTKTTESSSKANSKTTLKSPTESSSRKPVSRPKPKGNGDLRTIEVNQLKIRFAPTGFTMIKGAKSTDDFVKLQCVMPITDPDFAYDVSSVRLEILLPKGYPGSKEAPIRPSFVILNSDIPAAIIDRIERNLRWGLNSLEGGVLVCRPMLRYLEDNLEKWMVDDVRESAFKFVKPSEIKVTEKDSEDTIKSIEHDDDDDVEALCDKIASSAVISVISCTNPPSSRISCGDWLAPAPIIDQSSVGGTSFTLKMTFSTIRGIDLLTSQLITFLAACDRCKFNFPVEDLRPFVDRIEHCPKCTAQTKFYYKAQLVTPAGNFEDDEWEAILGTVRFLRAKPVDLLPTLYQCSCSKCYGNESLDNTDFNNTTTNNINNNTTNNINNTTTNNINNITTNNINNANSSCKIEKVRIGENIVYNCFNCHQKNRFQIDRIEWCADSTNSSSTTSTKKTKSSGPTLTVGTPLPNCGACEHYKKSFRWYRFPCCGQAFPCDECHGKEHEVQWATRFICGFCSREQSINVKECPECGKDTSASAKRHTSFWEGGKGVRNQIVMNRKDSKKYKNYSTNSSSTLATKPKKKKEKEKEKDKE